MSARAAAGYFALGILAGVVISEAVSRATQARAEAEATVPARRSTVPRLTGAPLPRFAPYSAETMPPRFLPVPAVPVPAVPAVPAAVSPSEFTESNGPVSHRWNTDFQPVKTGFQPVNSPSESVPNPYVSAAQSLFHTGETRTARRTWLRKRSVIRRGMARISRRARQLGHAAGYAAGFAVALAMAALRRMAELPSLPAVTWEPAPVHTFGRVLDGQGVRLAVRCRPLRGGPAGPVLARPFPALTGEVLPV